MADTGERRENMTSPPLSSGTTYPPSPANNTRPSTATSETLSQQYARADSLQREPSTSKQYQSRPSPLNALIDPALFDVHSTAMAAYPQNPFQTSARPDITHAHSYGRYDAATSNSQIQSLYPPTSGVCANPMRQTGKYVQSDKVFLRAPAAQSPVAPSPVDNINFDDERVDTQTSIADRPNKRIRYYAQSDLRSSSVVGEMPPPHTAAWQYSHGYITSQPIPTNESLFGTPPIPGALSPYADEPYQAYPIKLPPYLAPNSPDFRRLSQDISESRRLSVESLLSGPPGMRDEPTPRSCSLGSSEPSEEMVIYGVDRGIQDLDVGKNDDAGAISGGSPITMREHNHHVNGDADDSPIEFGFGVQTKDTAFQKNDYYAQ
jgi:hypothetical protein